MNAKFGSPSTNVQSQLKAISLIATGTLATFGGLIMALPVFDFWAKVLPTPGNYEAIARAAGILLSALLAYREVRHEWSPFTRESRPDGVPQVMIGGLLTLVYLITQGLPLGEWANLLYAIEYCGIVVLMSFGFVRLAKKAFDCSNKKAKVAELLSSGTAQMGRTSSDDLPFIRFSTAFFAGITATVTGFAILNQIVSILPPIVRNLAVANTLSVLIATIIIGSNYTSQYLEETFDGILRRQLPRITEALKGRNMVEAGIGPVLIGLVCIVLFLVGDTSLQSTPSDNVLVEMLLIILQVSIFSFVSYGLWRMGVNEYEWRKRQKK